MLKPGNCRDIWLWKCAAPPPLSHLHSCVRTEDEFRKVYAEAKTLKLNYMLTRTIFRSIVHQSTCSYNILAVRNAVIPCVCTVWCLLV